MAYWLMKSEPDVWSITKQKKVGPKGITWDGVRNYQAANNLKFPSKARWPLDASAPFLKGPGLKI